MIKERLIELLASANLKEVKFGPRWVNATITFDEEDKDAAWELYVEILTRTATQKLGDEEGDEATALASVSALFGLTREVLKRKGRKTENFTKVAVPVLNQVIRPFTARWHGLAEQGGLKDGRNKQEFRKELKRLQEKLRDYNKLLAKIAEVEDLTDLEECS